ncbi:MAG TPA: hypothetical protein VIP11_23980 [Gemmatimonadaceae bacterium]
MTMGPQDVGARVERAISQAVEQAVAQSLQKQITSITTQLESMSASRADLVRRLQAANGQDAVRLQEALAQHDASVVELQGRLERINSRLLARHLQNEPPAQAPDFPGPGILVPPPAPDLPRAPYGIDANAFTAAFIILVIGIVVPLSVGLTRRLWRRPQPVAAPRDTEGVSKSRLDRLEQAVDTIAIEIERISEGQRFVTKVLTERPVAVRPAANEASDPKSLGEGTPFLALGAGPIEPIRAAERQAVKQSITPH